MAIKSTGKYISSRTSRFDFHRSSNDDASFEQSSFRSFSFPCFGENLAERKSEPRELLSTREAFITHFSVVGAHHALIWMAGHLQSETDRNC